MVTAISPSNVIAEYNLEYGTNYSREEMDLETGTLDGKSLQLRENF